MRRDFTYDEQTPLTPEEAKRRPLHDLVPLYVDLMVDRPHSMARSVFGFEPPEELELQTVFPAKGFSGGARYGRKLVVAPREALLRMKMNALPGRTKSHKVHKDMADIFALVATYEGRRADLRTAVGATALVARVLEAAGAFQAEDWEAVTAFTGAPAATVRTLLSTLAPWRLDRAVRPTVTQPGKAGARRGARAQGSQKRGPGSHGFPQPRGRGGSHGVGGRTARGWGGGG